MVVTLKDVAKAVNLSVHSVSDVLNCGDSRYSKETVKRIHEAAKRLGYRVNRAAQVLSRGKSGMIGYVTMANMLQPAMERSSYITHAISNAGYRIDIETLGGERGDCDSICEFFLSTRVEGIIFGAPTDSFTPEHAKRFRAAGIPVVMMASQYMESVPLVVIDRRRAFYDLTRHLLQMGHRRLMVCTNWHSSLANEKRLVGQIANGFMDAIREAGGELVLPDAPPERNPGDSRIQGEVFAEHGGWKPFDPYIRGQSMMLQLLEQKKLPDAILWNNDQWAVGALGACYTKGIRVPRDLAMTGFDNTSLGLYTIPPLTSVKQPIEQMCIAAVDMLLRQIQGKKLSKSEMLIELPCELVIRESSAGKKSPSEK